MIRLAIVVVLVLGSFGILWTAPWKDDVDRARERVTDALSTLDQKTGGECSAYGRQVPDAVSEAVDRIAEDGAGDAGLADRARQQADAIAACMRQVPSLAPSWGDVERRLRSVAP